MSNERKITNTTQRYQQDPMLALADAMIFGASGSIERQEAIGQSELVNSADLPTEGSEDPTWALFGVTFGPTREGDEIFRSATLPAGWKKVGTDHAMWSKLVDQDGNERAMIFYKAAFYDRSAHMRITPRFCIVENYDLNYGPDGAHRRDDERKIQHEIKDKGRVIYSTATVTLPDGKREDYEKQRETQDAQNLECEAWLTSNGYPDWQNRAAYWT